MNRNEQIKTIASRFVEVMQSWLTPEEFAKSEASIWNDAWTFARIKALGHQDSNEERATFDLEPWQG